MRNYVYVALGGAIGSVARYWLSGAFARWIGAGFPWATLCVNVTGSLLIGFFAALTAADGRNLLSPGMRTFLMVGICGGYTTFSSFSLQTMELAQGGQWLKAGGNILASVASCLVAVWLGHTLATWLHRT
ncbi:MAG: fluoride efflux transporter CrcB [Spirochaetes bacterium]|nr:fluoride efflux transporter CrcB [Spirochaetota bacterium]